MSERILVRSYRRVFRLDRRIYRIDRVAIPVPGGLPLAGLLWFLGGLLGVLFASVLPGIGSAVEMLSPPVRFLVLPATLAVLATQLAPDGRSAARFASSWLAHRLRARRRSAGRPVFGHGVRFAPEPVHLRADEHGPDLRRARVRGPAQVKFRDPVVIRRGRRGRVDVRPAATVSARVAGNVTQEVELGPRERAEVRP